MPSALRSGSEIQVWNPRSRSEFPRSDFDVKSRPRSRSDFSSNSDLAEIRPGDFRPGSADPESTSVLDLGFPPKSDSALPWI